MRKSVISHSLQVAVIAYIIFGGVSSPNIYAQSKSNSFDDFRASIMSGYNDFRSNVLANYDKWLDGEWVPYEGQKGLKRDSLPKPEVLPTVDGQPPLPKPKPESSKNYLQSFIEQSMRPHKDMLKKVDFSKLPKEEQAPVAQVPEQPQQPVAPETKPEKPETKPEVAETKPVAPQKPESKPENKPESKPEPAVPSPSVPSPSPLLSLVQNTPTPAPTPAPKQDPTPAPAAAPTPTSAPASKQEPQIHVDFFETDIAMNEVGSTSFKECALRNPNDFAAQWRHISGAGLEKDVVAEINKTAKKLGLNDYLKYELTAAFVRERYKSFAPNAKTAVLHYLLANMEYDVRLGLSDAKNAILLIPFKEQIFARPYLTIDGKNYYVFADASVDLNNPANLCIATCKLPKEAATASAMELKLGALNLPERPVKYELKSAELEIAGEFNGAILPVVYRYPQMDMGLYAQSNLLPQVRDNIVASLKQQIDKIVGPIDSEEKKLEAANLILKFCQYSREYARDEVSHGFEKPYFMEETLFYPQCDCEDRAIMYTYLLWNVLGMECHLINYPGHESASVNVGVEIPNAKSYNHQGKKFYISDPTYIGAKTGKCMPNYIRDIPKVDFSYTK